MVSEKVEVTDIYIYKGIYLFIMLKMKKNLVGRVEHRK